MFVVDCPVIGARALIFASQIRSVTNHNHGIDVAFRCVCGGKGVWRSGVKTSGEQLLCHYGPDESTNSPAGLQTEVS